MDGGTAQFATGVLLRETSGIAPDINLPGFQ